MTNMWLAGFLLLSGYFTSALVVPDNIKPHQTKRQQIPQKCDLICPGQPPLSLPPNFLHNCTSAGNNPPNTSKPVSTSTVHPHKTTTTESDEEQEESTENEATTTTRISTTQKHQKSHRRKPAISRKHPQKKSKQHRQKHHVKKHTVVLKREAKSRLFKRHKGLKDKLRLDGCYVICSEENGDGDQGDDGDADDDDDGGSSESDSGDDYVEGEDTPIEIIYVPPLEQAHQRPYDVYQIPLNPYEYEPLFFEGKHKKNKKRKHHIEKNCNHTKPGHQKRSRTSIRV